MKGLIKPDSRGRSIVRIKASKSTALLKIESDDLSAFKAAINSTLRDALVVASTSSAIEKRNRNA